MRRKLESKSGGGRAVDHDEAARRQEREVGVSLVGCGVVCEGDCRDGFWQKLARHDPAPKHVQRSGPHPRSINDWRLTQRGKIRE